MNKIYAFIIIIPLIAILFFRTMAFYEFDTKQRYIKNAVDSAAHKVMITGVLTNGDINDLKKELHKMGRFETEDIVLERGIIDADGTISGLNTYVPGNILNRGEVFSILVQSKEQPTLSKMEGAAAGQDETLYFKAKAVCRIEKVRDAG